MYSSRQVKREAVFKSPDFVEIRKRRRQRTSLRVIPTTPRAGEETGEQARQSSEDVLLGLSPHQEGSETRK